jgi:hypothetical protein
MRYLLVTVLFLLLAVAADATAVEFSFPMAVNVTISVAATVPLAGDDLVIDDTFVLKGLGNAFDISFPPGVFTRSITTVDFRVSGGGVSATGSVERIETMEAPFHETFFSLVTPLYQLGFGGPVVGVLDVNARQASFGALSNEIGLVRITVGEEDSFLDGTASFSGTGFAIPEPGTAALLVLGATAMAVWRMFKHRNHDDASGRLREEDHGVREGPLWSAGLRRCGASNGAR